MIVFRENEKIYLTKRRHHLVLWLEILPIKIIFLMIIISAIVLFFNSSLFWPQWLVDFFPDLLGISLPAFLFFVLSLLFLISWVSLFLIIAHYYLDCWIVTSERTIHTELKGLFSRTVSSVPHERIQDITVEINGILQTFFRYGDLHIQTAGGFRDFVFQQIPKPNETKDIIFKARNEFLNNKNSYARD